MPDTDIQAERKPARIEDRVIEGVIDHGRLVDLSNTRVLLDSFFDQGIKRLLVTPGEVVATHWWMLRMQSGTRIAYFGTQESFGQFTRDGQGHLYEFGRSGKL